MSAKTILKVYGERNTGTNFLCNLLENNLPIKLLTGTVKYRFFKVNEATKNLYFKLSKKNNLGWKHAAVDVSLVQQHKELNQLGIVCLVKNPYSFTLSLNKRPYHNKHKSKLRLDQFVSSPWQLQERDELNAQVLESPVLLWNKKVASYFELKKAMPNQVYILRYEDLIDNPEQATQDMARFFHVEANQQFVNMNESTKKEDKKFKDYRAYYLEEQWRSKLDNKSIDLINNNLDKTLVQELDYNWIEKL